ncbi:MAG: hypothetical protein DELT_01820 [Desulfovibrio sp.]
MQSIKHFVEIILSVIASAWGILKTPCAVIWSKLSRLLSWYKRLWVKYTHNKYDEFVYKRGVGMVAATAVCLVLIPTALGVVLDTAYYFATHKKESIYLIQSEEIFPEDNIWGVRGCYTQNCDSTSSLYYRIKPSVFNHLWNLGHNGNIFLPDTIGSSVPTGLTRCEVDSYGIRLRILMTFNIYPSVLQIMCEDYGALPPRSGNAETRE